MQEDTLHILIVVRMTMAMIVSFMSMVVSMTVVSMSKCGETDNIDQEAKDTNDQKLIQSLEFMAFPKTLRSIGNNLDTDEQEEHTVGETR